MQFNLNTCSFILHILLEAISFYTPVFRRDVLWYGDVRPSGSPSVRLSVRPFSPLFSYMLWHIELKFCTWICFNVLYRSSLSVFTLRQFLKELGSIPVDFLRPKFRIAHTKDDVISILMHKYTYTNMYIIKKIISCRFILCWDITSLFKPYVEKSCWRQKNRKILTMTYHTLLTKATNFLKSGGYKICLYLKIISYST